MKYLQNFKLLISLGLFFQIDQAFANFDPNQLLANLNKFAETPLPLLIQAVEKGDFQEVQTIVKRNVDVNEMDKHNRTALMCAVKMKRKDMVALLIEHGADPHVIAWNDATPLREAVVVNDKNLVEQFIKIHSEYKQKSMGYALVEAAYQNNKAFVEFFINEGVNPNSCACVKLGGSFPTTTTALIEAARNGNDAIVKFLLNRGADRDCVDSSFGSTALRVAQNNGHKNIVKLLQGK